MFKSEIALQIISRRKGWERVSANFIVYKKKIAIKISKNDNSVSTMLKALKVERDSKK